MTMVYHDGSVRYRYTDVDGFELVPLDQPRPSVRGYTGPPRLYKAGVDPKHGESRWKNTIFGQASCDWCGAEKNLTIHHFVPTGKGGRNVRSNRMVLCRPHHDCIHRTRKKVPEGMTRRQWRDSLHLNQTHA